MFKGEWFPGDSKTGKREGYYDEKGEYIPYSSKRFTEATLEGIVHHGSIPITDEQKQQDEKFMEELKEMLNSKKS